jgi:YVTN family beta-propeller protein
MRIPATHQGGTARRILGAGLVALALFLTVSSAADARRFSGPTYSSPIALSADGRYVWSVNPGADTVSVIRTSTNTVVKTIAVGDEPQSVALDPNNRWAFVANAAASTVTVIKIKKASKKRFKAGVYKRAGKKGALTTGAEPWNIVTSPDGRRVFVANSSQDTISVINVKARPRGRGKRRKSGPRVLGNVKLPGSACNRDRNFHFQPRGLAVTKNSRKLYVTSFLAFTKLGGRQGDDAGKQGLVCRLNIKTKSKKIRAYRPRALVALAPQVTGFTVDATGDGVPDATAAFPNQLQSIVIHGNQAYLPNIAASPDGPLRFNVDTQAFVNVIDNVSGSQQADASASKFLNLHLGARNPEQGKKRLFFANVWAMAFTNRSGPGAAYVVSSGSDLLVKVGVDGAGKLGLTVDADTTRYIDLNDPANPATAGDNAGKNPQGIVINKAGTTAYVQNFVSRNVSVVNLTTDSVVKAIRTAPLAAPGSPGEAVAVGAEMFFSSRGHFNRPAGATVSTDERLSSEGWQSCSSCHFKGLTDGVIWEFAAGPRKSVPLNATFNPHNPADQRVLNYSAIFDEVDDFTANVRNISGPGPLAAAVPCSAPPPATSTFDPNHGLIIGDNGDINTPPCVINSLAAKANAERPQVTVTLPGSSTAVPALSALREWVRVAVRTPNGPLVKKGLGAPISRKDVKAGAALFSQAGCMSCHVGNKFTQSTKDFVSPPAATEIFTERTPPQTFGNPVAVPYLARFLRDVGSFNIGVPGAANDLPPNVGAIEKATATLTMGVAQPQQDALGTDYNGDGKGIGYNVPSLLGINAVPPYYHNGACETLACVVNDLKHRTANGKAPDKLTSAKQRRQVTAFLKSIDAKTPAP